MSVKLYELTAQYRDALEQLEASEDLPEEVIRDTLEGLSGELQIKATQVAMFIRNLESTVDMIEAAALGMQLRAERARKRADSLKEYLLLNMQMSGISKIESPFFSLVVRNNPQSVAVDNESEIPERYMRTPPPAPPPKPAPDKRAIGDALKAGIEVAGCRLEQKQRLEIRV